MTMRYVKLSAYRKRAFSEGGVPDPRTLRKMIDNGELAGKRMGAGKWARYYVLIDARTGLEAEVLRQIRPVNRLAAAVLEKAAG